MQVEIFTLRFKGRFHLGSHTLGLETTLVTIPSDTLFSALCVALGRIGGDVQAWIEAFPRSTEDHFFPADPPFLLTSAFPFYEGTLFFPRPHLIPGGLPPEALKAWKGLEFMDRDLFQEISQDFGRVGTLLGTKPPAGHPIWTRRPIPLEGGWREHNVPRVTLDRLSNASNLFSIRCISFRRGWGLWFGVVWRDPERACGDTTFREAFEAALVELSQEGIGGDRTAGYGAFQASSLGLESWPDPTPGKPFVLLSRYHPKVEEHPRLQRGLARELGYEVEEVGGWSATIRGHFRRRTVRMFSPGSVLMWPGEGPAGDLVDVSPLDPERRPLSPHPIWRYGLAFPFPVGDERATGR